MALLRDFTNALQISKENCYLCAAQPIAHHGLSPFIHRMSLNTFSAKSIPTVAIFIAGARIRKW
jgi:hypothetical protein